MYKSNNEWSKMRFVFRNEMKSGQQKRMKKSCETILGSRQNVYNAFYLQSISSILVLFLNVISTVLETPHVARCKPKKYTVPWNVMEIKNKTSTTLNYRTTIVPKILAFRGGRSQWREKETDTYKSITVMFVLLYQLPRFTFL